MPKLILIRGLPGSGKSTMAKDLARQFGYYHVETDQWFQTPDGYKFNPKELDAAHKWCQKEAARALANGNGVVVSNTFTQKWEILPYKQMADSLGAEFHVLTAAGNFQNVHGVSQEAIERMRKRWEQW